jgi:ABC-type multidrug transport system ATPase subunit
VTVPARGTEDTTPAIAARKLTRRYGPIPAVDDLDLTVPAGQFVLLLGSNGAGKSTLLRLFATLMRPSSGALELLGRDAGGAGRTALLGRLGYLSHSTLLYDHLTGYENLLFYGRLYGLEDPRRAAEEGIRAAGLAGRGSDLVCTYSRGMQQRVAISRAMLHRPDLLLLDEPFTGLDRDAADRLEERLGSERDARRTCIMATHDLGAGARLADRVLVLEAGRLVLDRPARGLGPGRLEVLLREATRTGPGAVGLP